MNIFEARWKTDIPDWMTKTHKFWYHRDLCNYARSKGLKDVVVATAQERGSGELIHVIFDRGQPCHEDQSYEGVACYIDTLWVKQKFDEGEHATV
jgi:hypothetical protein